MGAENVPFNEEQKILINNNVREDRTLISNKNKIDFAIDNNQLKNDNNLNKARTFKSFFRMD